MPAKADVRQTKFTEQTTEHLHSSMTTAVMTDTLSSVTASLQDARSSLPTSQSILPPANGISLLDAKNELFLSYAQDLALKMYDSISSLRSELQAIRQQPSESKAQEDMESRKSIDAARASALLKRLVERRVYLTRGVKPLETQLAYQITKVLRAADDEGKVQAATGAAEKKSKTASRSGSSGDGSDNESDDDGSEQGSEDEDADEEDIDELAYRPNPSAFAPKRKAAPPGPSPTTRPTKSTSSATDRAATSGGVYRPPRITATSMPDEHQRRTSSKRDADNRPSRSATLDEYVSTELSGIPSAEPSIGSTITARGRKDKSAKERAQEAERKEYEETNLVRLPGVSKKEKAQMAGGRGGDRSSYGGEEWRGLGEGLDRIERLTKKSGGKSGSGGAALESSRKRRATEDGPRGDGVSAGSAFERKRPKVMRRLK